VVMLASVKIVQTMKRGIVGTTKSRFLSAARISSYVGFGFVETVGVGGISTGGGGGSSASVMCLQRGHGVGATFVGVELGGLLRT
jgi:hypothetical protein